MFTWTCVCLEARCCRRVSSPVAFHCVSLRSRFHGSSSIWVGWLTNELQGSPCLCPAPLPVPGLQMCVSTPSFYAGNGNLSLGPYAQQALYQLSQQGSPRPCYMCDKNTHSVIMSSGIFFLIEDFYCYFDHFFTTFCSL